MRTGHQRRTVIGRHRPGPTAQLSITVPTIVMEGDGDGVMGVGGSAHHQRHFTAAYERREIPLVGHNLPQEAPQDFAAAVLALI